MKDKKKKPCPTCKGPVETEGNEFRPFCSARCKLIDLGNWASEKYKIAGKELGDEDGIEDLVSAKAVDGVDDNLDEAIDDEMDEAFDLEDDEDMPDSDRSEKKWRHDA